MCKNKDLLPVKKSRFKYLFDLDKLNQSIQIYKRRTAYDNEVRKELCQKKDQ